MKWLSVVLIICFCNPAFGQKSIFDHFKQTGKDAFDTTGLIILGVGTVATAIAAHNDQGMHDSWKNYQRMNEGTASVGDFWGTGIPAAGIALGQLYFDNDNGVPSVEGLLWSTGVTTVLKYTVRRPRPDSDTRTSFPSGHTQIAFSSATTLLYSYGWKMSLPFYGMAVLTGLSRVADNAHWLSDVVAGATIGVLFGRAGFNHHGISVAMMDLDPDDRGAGLVVSWGF